MISFGIFERADRDGIPSTVGDRFYFITELNQRLAYAKSGAAKCPSYKIIESIFDGAYQRTLSPYFAKKCYIALDPAEYEQWICLQDSEFEG